jgi:hypothetical protein
MINQGIIQEMKFNKDFESFVRFVFYGLKRFDYRWNLVCFSSKNWKKLEMYNHCRVLCYIHFFDNSLDSRIDKLNSIRREMYKTFFKPLGYYSDYSKKEQYLGLFENSLQSFQNSGFKYLTPQEDYVKRLLNYYEYHTAKETIKKYNLCDLSDKAKVKYFSKLLSNCLPKVKKSKKGKGQSRNGKNRDKSKKFTPLGFDIFEQVKKFVHLYPNCKIESDLELGTVYLHTKDGKIRISNHQTENSSDLFLDINPITAQN